MQVTGVTDKLWPVLDTEIVNAGDRCDGQALARSGHRNC